MFTPSALFLFSFLFFWLIVKQQLVPISAPTGRRQWYRLEVVLVVLVVLVVGGVKRGWLQGRQVFHINADIHQGAAESLTCTTPANKLELPLLCGDTKETTATWHQRHPVLHPLTVCSEWAALHCRKSWDQIGLYSPWKACLNDRNTQKNLFLECNSTCSCCLMYYEELLPAYKHSLFKTDVSVWYAYANKTMSEKIGCFYNVILNVCPCDSLYFLLRSISTFDSCLLITVGCSPILWRVWFNNMFTVNTWTKVLQLSTLWRWKHSECL